MRTSLRIAWRSLRGRRKRALILGLIVALGVTGLAAVRSLTTDLKAVVDQQGRTLLGADIELSMPAELTADQKRALADVEQRGGAVQAVNVVPMVAQAGERQAMVQLRVVDPRVYPWYGRFDLEGGLKLSDALSGNQAVIGQALAIQLSLKAGDTFRLLDKEFSVRAVLKRDPFAAANNPLSGPPVLLAKDAIALPQQVQHQALIKLPAGQTGADLQTQLKASFGTRMRHYSEISKTTQSSLERAAKGLTLVASIALVLGILSIASTVRTFIAESTEEIAVLKVLGMEQPDIVTIFVVQLLIAGGAGSVLGGLGGVAVRGLVSRLLDNVLPLSAQGIPLSWGPVVGGVAVGLAMCLLAALPALATLESIRPYWILRSRSADEPVPVLRSLLVGLAVVVGVCAIVAAMSGLTAVPFMLGVGVVSALLYGVGRGMLGLIQRIPGRRLLWHLTRRNLKQQGAPAAVVALSVGTFLLVGLGLTQDTVLSNLKAQGGSRWLPNLYLLQVTGTEKADIERWLSEKGLVESSLPSYATARGQLAAPKGDAKSLLVMETNSQFPVTIDQGRGLTDEDTGKARVIMRSQEANSMQVHVGDKVQITLDSEERTWEVVGLFTNGQQSGFSIQVDAPVITPVGALGDRVSYVMPLRIKQDSLLPVQSEVVGRYPGVLPVSLSDLLTTVEGTLETAAVLLRYVTLLALLTGAVAVAGAVAATQMQRRKEVALLKVLGVGQTEVMGLQLVENFVIGLGAGLAGTVTALLIVGVASLLLTGLGLALGAVVYTLVLWPVATAVIAMLAANVAMYGVFRESPLATLRSQE